MLKPHSWLYIQAELSINRQILSKHLPAIELLFLASGRFLISIFPKF